MENNRTGGIGFFGLLGILFIGLKLTNYIAWSWLWVLSPLWIPFLIVLIIVITIIIFFIFYGIGKIIFS